MSSKAATAQHKDKSKRPQPKQTRPTAVPSPNTPTNAWPQATPAPDQVTPAEAAYWQHTIGNQALGQVAGTSSDEPTADLAQSSLQSILHHSANIVVQSQPVQRQSDEEELQAKPADPPAGGPVTADLEKRIQAARGNGRPLPENVRQPMEQAFQTDFNDVKIHTHEQADQLNRSLSARAFTTGQDIFFRDGAYDPDTPSGKELLAHELTHVVQQNGNTAQAKPVISQPGDREEQEADAVGRFVAQHGDAARQADQSTPLPAKIKQMQSVQNSVQRAGMGGKIGLAIGKGFLMSFVKAIAGPLMFISRSERKSLARNWKEYGDEDKYVSKHLGRMGKASTVFQQIGALAGWVSLLTGVAALIAAAFAPAGLAASAVLGSISAIAGLVAAGAGAVTFGLSTILLISNLARISSLPKNSLVRKKAIIAAIQDGSAALSGLIAAVGGVVGAAMGNFQFVQSSSDVATAGVSGLAKDLGIGTGAGQAFALSDEVQGEVGGVLQEEKKRSLQQNPNFQQFRMGREAMKKRQEIVNLKRLPLQRAPDEESSEDASPQVLQELSKVEEALGKSKNATAKDKTGLNSEQELLSTAGTDLAQADKGIQQAKGIEEIESNLQQIEQQSEEGANQVEGKGEAEAAAPDSESEAQDKISKLEEANIAIDNLESQSGEKFGQKPSFLGKLKSKVKSIFKGIKRGAKKVGRLFVSAFVNIKARLKGIFKKIKQKVAKFLIKVTGLKEPLAAVETEVNSAQEALPETTEGTNTALAGIALNESQQEQLQDSLQQAKDILQS